jgi:hypothetical protein
MWLISGFHSGRSVANRRTADYQEMASSYTGAGVGAVLLRAGGSVARRQGSGVVSAWADAQRRRQREIETKQRAWQAAQDEQARAQRTAVRAQARDHREALRAYQQGRDADAAARTGELDAGAAGLGRILGGSWPPRRSSSAS